MLGLLVEFFNYEFFDHYIIFAMHFKLTIIVTIQFKLSQKSRPYYKHKLQHT